MAKRTGRPDTRPRPGGVGPPPQAWARGPRVCLRPLRDEDLPAVEPWYGEAAAAVMGLPAAEASGVQSLYRQLEAARSERDGGWLAIARGEEPVLIGLLDYRTGGPEPAWLTVGFIAVARPFRGRGYGSEAVRLLELEASRRRRVSRFRANVDMRNGLGLYFWLRLGYRPSAPGADAQGRNVVPMVRGAD